MKAQNFNSPVGTEVEVWRLEEEAGRWKSTDETRFCSGEFSLPCIKAEIYTALKFRRNTKLISYCGGLLNPAEKCSLLSSALNQLDDQR